MLKLTSKMENERQTAGETAKTVNPFHERIIQLNHEEREATEAVWEKIREVHHRQHDLNVQREAYFNAINEINEQRRALQSEREALDLEKRSIRERYKAMKAQVTQEMAEWLREHHSTSWWWAKIDAFCKDHPEAVATIMAEEGGEL